MKKSSKKVLKVLATIPLVLIIAICVFIAITEINYWTSYFVHKDDPSWYFDPTAWKFSVVFDSIAALIAVLSVLGLKKLFFPSKASQKAKKRNVTMEVKWNDIVACIVWLIFGVVFLLLDVVIVALIFFAMEAIAIWGLSDKIKADKYNKANGIVKKNKVKLIEPEAHPYARAEQFYAVCNEAGIILTETSSVADIARAKLVAEEKNFAFSEDDIVNVYLLGKSETERWAREEEYQNLYNQAVDAEKYISHHGRDKLIYMLAAELSHYETQRDLLLSGKAVPQQKEHDWALMGGIASGLAGGAAGLAVAADLQVKNAAIRASNAQMESNYAQMIQPVILQLGEKAHYCRKRLEKAKRLLVDDTAPETLFKAITFQEKDIFVLNSGEMVVKATVNLPYVTIYETVKARIDGTLTAVISQKGSVIGEAPMIIPHKADKYYDDHHIEYTLIGACPEIAEADIPCEVSFKYRDLWAIEK